MNVFSTINKLNEVDKNDKNPYKFTNNIKNITAFT